MESTNAANEFVGSPFFIVFIVIALLGIAFLLRSTFKPGKEYRHNPDE